MRAGASVGGRQGEQRSASMHSQLPAMDDMGGADCTAAMPSMEWPVAPRRHKKDREKKAKPPAAHCPAASRGTGRTLAAPAAVSMPVLTPESPDSPVEGWVMAAPSTAAWSSPWGAGDVGPWEHGVGPTGARRAVALAECCHEGSEAGSTSSATSSLTRPAGAWGSGSLSEESTGSNWTGNMAEHPESERTRTEGWPGGPALMLSNSVAATPASSLPQDPCCYSGSRSSALLPFQPPEKSMAIAPLHKNGSIWTAPQAIGPDKGAHRPVPGIIAAIAGRHTPRPPRMPGSAHMAPGEMGCLSGGAPVESGFRAPPRPALIEALSFCTASDVGPTAGAHVDGSFTDRSGKALRQQPGPWLRTASMGDQRETRGFYGALEHTRQMAWDTPLEKPPVQAHAPSPRPQATAVFSQSLRAREGGLPHRTHLRAQATGMQGEALAQPMFEDLYASLEIPAVVGPTAPVPPAGPTFRRALSVQKDRPRRGGAADPGYASARWGSQDAWATYEEAPDSFGRTTAMASMEQPPRQSHIEVAGTWAPPVWHGGRQWPLLGQAVALHRQQGAELEFGAGQDEDAICSRLEAVQLLEGGHGGHRWNGRIESPVGQLVPRPQPLAPGAGLQQQQVRRRGVGFEHVAGGSAMIHGKALNPGKQAVPCMAARDAAARARGKHSSPVNVVVHSPGEECGNDLRKSCRSPDPVRDAFRRMDVLLIEPEKPSGAIASAGSMKPRVRFKEPEVATEVEGLLGVKAGNHRVNKSPVPRPNRPPDAVLKSGSDLPGQSKDGLQEKHRALDSKGKSTPAGRSLKHVALLRKPVPANTAGRR